jgi:hypothetical protein
MGKPSGFFKTPQEFNVNDPQHSWGKSKAGKRQPGTG